MISFLVPTLGRPSLLATLRFIECWPGDEILLVGENLDGQYSNHPNVRYIPCPRGNDWGHTERNYAMQFAQGRYIAHIDDDDIYAPGTRALMADAIAKTPDRPVLFRMKYPNGVTLWREEKIYCGNVGTPMMLIPNKPDMFGTWESFVGGDCRFLETSKWREEDYVWRPEIVALLGHNV